ncbi:hypothetical protein DY000_02047796 [Brassica cretica]|uniref:Uncharacterized protein n=1 Tax=Brassica cretica TaxID=69181 RepID=A0ABQ7EZD2_BRACR|nr:hypothetical protein DY000_02047796 [Brassica cretica]
MFASLVALHFTIFVTSSLDSGFLRVCYVGFKGASYLLAGCCVSGALDFIFYPFLTNASPGQDTLCILEIFGASIRDDHRARPSVDIEELISIDILIRTSIDNVARRKPVWSQPT